MKQGLLILLMALWAIPAYAELPDEILEKEYQNCMGNDTAADRAAYCACIRTGMKSWNMNDYVAISQQTSVAATTSGASMPARVEELARKCIAEVLR